MRHRASGKWPFADIFIHSLSLSSTGGHFASKSEQGDISGKRRLGREERSEGVKP